jgi:hypothetical protein
LTLKQQLTGDSSRSRYLLKPLNLALLNSEISQILQKLCLRVDKVFISQANFEQHVAWDYRLAAHCMDMLHNPNHRRRYLDVSASGFGNDNRRYSDRSVEV